MAINIHGFVANAFRGPDLAGVDQARSQNALMRNQVQRLPQINRAQDLAIQQADQGLQMGQMELDQAGQKNALGIIGRGLSMIRDKNSAAQIIADPSFQSAAQALKLPPMQITPEDTDEGILQQRTALLQAIGIGGAQMPAGLAEFEGMASAGNLSQEERARAARVNLGIQGRAGQGRVTMVNNVPTWTGMGDDGQPFQMPLSSVGSEADAAQRIAQAESLGKLQAEASSKIMTRATNADGVLALLDLADPLIDVSTGSGSGAARDKLMGFFGYATDGAQAAGQLQVIQAGLILGMPRLEGPQSDKDRALYIEAAGQIGNPNVPAAIKKAAVRTIGAIQRRHAGGAGPANGGGPQVGTVEDGYRYIGGDPSQPTSWQQVQ